LRQLAGLGCGAGATSLRTASLSLVHSTAEYGALAWCHSAHSASLIASSTVLPTLWFSSEFGLVFLWSSVFLETCGLLVFGLVLIEISLFFSYFCFADCFFQIVWSIAVSI